MSDGFVQVPNFVADHPNLNGKDIAVYVAIRRSINGNGESSPGIRTIQARSGLSVNTVLKVIKRLEAAGVFTVDRRQRHIYCFILDNTRAKSASNEITDCFKRDNASNGVPLHSEQQSVIQNEAGASNEITKVLHSEQHIYKEDLLTNKRKSTRRVETWGRFIDQEGLTVALVTECADVFPEEQTRRLVAKALDHTARKKYTHMDLYVGDWVRGDAQKERDRRQRNGQTIGNHRGQSTGRSTTADADYINSLTRQAGVPP